MVKLLDVLTLVLSLINTVLLFMLWKRLNDEGE